MHLFGTNKTRTTEDLPIYFCTEGTDRYMTLVFDSANGNGNE